MRDSKNGLLGLTCLVFFLLGIITAVIGPALPELAENTGATLAKIGGVFTALFLGALVSQLVVGPVSDRLGQHRVLMVSLVVTAVGIFGIGFSHHFVLTLASAFLAGIGHGGVDVGGNVLIATVFNGRSVSALNLLNVFFGLGAFVGPAVASAFLSGWNTGLPVMWGCAAGMALSSLGYAFVKVGPARAGAPEAKTNAPAPAPAGGVYRSLALWVLGALILVYVGTENGIGGWTTTYLQRSAGLKIDQAALATSFFWLALTGGRMLSAGLGLRLSGQRLLEMSLGLATAAGALLVLGGGGATVSIAAVALLGLAFGPVYPTTIAEMSLRFPHAPGKAVAALAALGSIGGALLPLAYGMVLESAGPAWMAWLPLAGSAVMLGLLLLSRRARAMAALPADCPARSEA